MGTYNRTIVLIAYMLLCGWVAYLQVGNQLSMENALAILGLVGAPVAGYIGIKGKNAVETEREIK